tara:strand:- start:6863 stop:7450 length:588 start_codon:yes stop_codon:yes gene_type:complete
MFETKFSYQKSGYASPGGMIIPMPERGISKKNEVIHEGDIVNAVESYAQVLRHTEEKLLFKDFLLIHLNDNYFKESYPKGFYIEDKDSLKELIRKSIPDDVKGKYRDINENEGVSYVKDFPIMRSERITSLISRAKDLEEILVFQEQMEESREPAPIDPREVELIEEYIKSYSVEEAKGKFGEYKVTEVLPDELL